MDSGASAAAWPGDVPGCPLHGTLLWWPQESMRMLLFPGTLGRVLQPIVPSPVGDGAFPRQCGGWAAKPTCPQQWEQTTQP